jgi:hypothetical protein
MEKVLNTMENQYGENIPTAVLFQEDGLLRLWEINCLSALHYGLGNCLCENHPPSVEDLISTDEVVRRFGAEALDGFDEPSEAQIIFDAFGIEKDELETFLRISYMINLNPLPALRKRTEAEIAFGEDPDLLVFPDLLPGTVVFIINSRGEISVVTVEGRQTYEEVNISTEPDLDDPVGMPELAKPE